MPDELRIQYAVEEAYTGGIYPMNFVTSHTKRFIEDHFDKACEVESELEAENKRELLPLVSSIKPVDIQLCARELVGRDLFAVLLTDEPGGGAPPIMLQMVEQLNEWCSCILAERYFWREDTRKHGIVSGTEVNPYMVYVNAILERPTPEHAPSTLAVAGRLDIFFGFATQYSGVGGQVQLTDAIASLLRRERVFVAFPDQGKRYDYSSKQCSAGHSSLGQVAFRSGARLRSSAQ